MNLFFVPKCGYICLSWLEFCLNFCGISVLLIFSVVFLNSLALFFSYSFFVVALFCSKLHSLCNRGFNVEIWFSERILKRI